MRVCKMGAAGLCLIAAALISRGAGAADKPVTVELWGLVESRSYVGTFAAIRAFEERNPHIRIVVGTPGGQGHLDPQKLITATIAGTPPDVIWFGRHAMGMWAPRGAFRSLDDLMARDGVRIEDYYPGTFQEVEWEGRHYALPWNVDCRVLFCNLELLRRGGFDRPPEDWDELERMAVALTQYNPVRGRYDVLGFAPNYGNSWLFLYGWQLGARWLSDDGRRVRLADPEVVRALEWMTRLSDAVGGGDKVLAFQASAQYETIADPFLSDQLAMQINGNYILDYIARLRPDMDFVVTPPPPPVRGQEPPVSWSGGFSWVIPADARHPEEAWAFIKWMNSEEAWIIQAEAQREFGRRDAGEGALFVPFYHANRVINERLAERYTTDLPEKFREANRVCLELLPHSRFLPQTPACNELWDAQAKVIVDAMAHAGTPHELLVREQKVVQAALDRYFEPPTGPVVAGRTVARAVAAVVVLLLIAAIVAFVRALRPYRGLERRQALAGAGYVLPWVVGFSVFVIGPMIYSLVTAFTRYDVLHPHEFVGFDNWVRMFGFHQGETGWLANDPRFWRSLWNTLYMTLFGVPAGMAVSLAIALLLNTKVRGIGMYRTLFYVPVIVPVVASSFLFLTLLNPQQGLINYLISPLLHRLGLAAPPWFTDAAWAKPGLILLGVWGCGSTVIIWLAGLQTLPRHLYEAATLDGAGVFHRFRHITLPLLTPYILFLWIMGTIGSLQIFTQAYIIGAPGDALLFYALYLFACAFKYFEMGYASAMAWVLFALTVGICLWQLRLSKKWVYYESE